MRITRRLEFDAGHRIPDHRSHCRNIHGHRYALEITLSGEILDAPGQSGNGMVLDFADVKAIAQREVVEPWDHAFLVWRGDPVLPALLAALPDHKTVILERVPTAENLAQEAFRILDQAYRAHFGGQFRLANLRIYETPNCWADAGAQDLE